VNAGKVGHKSLRSKKGALKRKERVVKGEMERFGASMARLAGVVQAPAPREGARDVEEAERKEAPQPERAAAPATSNRWAALRGYISATMQQNPAFAGDG